jgi:arylsulfatase A-like enzyme
MPVKPINVIFILTDDQGPWAAGCYGNHEIQTPNIDRLAEQGMRFENFFCSSPVCSPARASLLTGRIPSQHGVHDWICDHNMPPDAVEYLEDTICYTDVLTEHGYVCGLSGKWHLGSSMKPQHGFTHWFVMPEGASKYQDAEMVCNGKLEMQPGYLTDVITDNAVTFMEKNKSRPFYLSVHYNAPHSPWDGHPDDLLRLYEDCQFKSCPQESVHPWARNWTHVNNNRNSLKGYFAAVTGLDRGVGRIMDKLVQLGLRENTLLVFTSDNGHSCGHHGFWGKGNGTYPLNMYENSIKVPFIVSHPGSIPAGNITEAMMSQYDFMPTLLDYLNLPLADDKTMPGLSFAPVWKGSEIQIRDEVVVYDEYGPVRMIRTKEWKYIHRYPYGPHELYDLSKDPDERVNLADNEKYQDISKLMCRNLGLWFERYVLSEMDGIRAAASGSGQKEKIGPDCPAEKSCYSFVDND